MILRGLTLAAVLLAGTIGAYAQVPSNFYPPAEFDRPFAGSLFIAEEQEQEVLLEACSMVGIAKYGLNGCTHLPNTHGLGPNECVILLAQKSHLNRYGVTQEGVIRHETAHCNGWRHKPRLVPAEAPPMMDRRDPVSYIQN
jgi:hypothetical protein